MQTEQKILEDKPVPRPGSDKPQARLDFAQRLRELRVPRGFRTARSLARTLDIDENRYTRYERAEVEPDLALIRRMCQVLAITPSELLGVPDSNGAQASSQLVAADHTEDRFLQQTGQATASRDEQPVTGVRNPRAVGVEFAAWRLACAAAEARMKSTAGPRGQEPSSATMLSIASPLYSRLRESPFEAIAELTADRAIAAAPLAVSGKVLAAIDALVGALRESTDPHPPI